jgi:hypothetical protein
VRFCETSSGDGAFELEKEEFETDTGTAQFIAMLSGRDGGTLVVSQMSCSGGNIQAGAEGRGAVALGSRGWDACAVDETQTAENN